MQYTYEFQYKARKRLLLLQSLFQWILGMNYIYHNSTVVLLVMTDRHYPNRFPNHLLYYLIHLTQRQRTSSRQKKEILALPLKWKIREKFNRYIWTRFIYNHTFKLFFCIFILQMVYLSYICILQEHQHMELNAPIHCRCGWILGKNHFSSFQLLQYFQS